MKPKIHPRWYPEATVTCVCGNKWTVGATVPAIRTDICSNCHPFFTGEQRIVDTEGQVDRFMRRLRARDESLQEVERRSAERTSPELLLVELGIKSRVLKLLAESDSDINIRNNDGETPLGVAKREGRDAAVKRLSELSGVE